MAKKTTPKPAASVPSKETEQAVVTDATTSVVTTAPTGVVTDTTTGVVTDAATGVVNDTTTGIATDTSQIEEATVLVTEGSPTPPALGNEGTAAAAGEGQSSLANPAIIRQPEDLVPLSAAIRASISLTVSEDPQGEPSLIVIGPKKGRWRIGRKFGVEPVTLLVDGLTEDDMKALAADPTLTIKVVAPPF